MDRVISSVFGYNHTLKKMSNLGTEPDFYEVHWRRGAQLFELDRKEEAEKELFSAISLQPDKASAYIQLAYCYVNWQERRHKALALIERTLTLAPQDAFLMALESVALRQAGRMGEALAAAELALRVEPRSVFALNQRTVSLYILERSDEALVNARSNVELNPGNLSAMELLVWILERCERSEEAKPIVNYLLSQRPNAANSHLSAGHLAVEDGEAGKAVKHFRTALSLDPTSQQKRAALIHGLNSRSILYRWHYRNQKWLKPNNHHLQFIVILFAFAIWIIGTVWLSNKDYNIFFQMTGISGWLIITYAALQYFPAFSNLFLLFDRLAWLALTLEQKTEAIVFGFIYGFALGLETYFGAWVAVILSLIIPAHLLWVSFFTGKRQ